MEMKSFFEQRGYSQSKIRADSLTLDQECHKERVNKFNYKRFLQKIDYNDEPITFMSNFNIKRVRFSEQI